MALFSIWVGEGGRTLQRGTAPHTFADGTLDDPTAVKVLEFQAASWNVACQRYNDYFGFGPYEFEPGWEEIGPDEE